MAELEPGLDISKYVAGAIVVFDMRTRAVKWRQHLDLSTDSTSFRAYIYSAPILVDLDRDGKLEIVVGTSAVGSPHHSDACRVWGFRRGGGEGAVYIIFACSGE